MIDCTTAVQQLWDFIERKLTADDETNMKEHLAFCRRCCGEVDFAQELRGMLKTAAGPTLPEEAEMRLNSFIDEIEQSDK